MDSDKGSGELKNESADNQPDPSTANNNESSYNNEAK
jgi:hypothetical protein